MTDKPATRRSTGSGKLGVINLVGASLRNTTLFRGVSDADLNALLAVMPPLTIPAGHVLFRKGDPGDSLYLTIRGRMRIYTFDRNGNEITLVTHGVARIFGDFSILDAQPRSATAEALEETELRVLRREDFLKFLPDHPSVGLAMVRNLCEQVRRVTTFLSKVNDALEHLSLGEYERAIQEVAVSQTDAEIQALVTAFVEMVRRIRERQGQP